MYNLSWVNSKITSVNCVYDWTKAHFLLNKEKGVEYYNNTKWLVQYTMFDVDWYGGIVNTCELPIRVPSSAPITEEFMNELKRVRTQWMLTDFAYWFWELWIVKWFDIYREMIGDIEVYFFYQKETKKDVLYWMTHEEIVDLLVLREFLEGKMIIDDNWFSKKTKIPTQTIELKTLSIKIPFNYTVGLRYTMTKDWKWAINNNKSYPTSAYYNWLTSGWIHAHTASRRYGKTRYAVPEMKSELLSVQFMERPRKIVYVAPSEARLSTMRRYLTSAFSKEIQMWLVSKLDSNDCMVLYRFDDKWEKLEDNLGEIQLYSAQADDVWVGDYYDWCMIDEIERILNRNHNVLSDLLSVATNEFWMFRLVSTINKQGVYTDFIKYLQLGETKKINIKEFLLSLWFKYWFSELDIKKLEKWDKAEIEKLKSKDFKQIRKDIMFFMDYTSFRVPWDNVETYSVDEKSKIKAMLLKEWLLSYITEWLCQLPEEVQSMEFEQQIVDHSLFQDKKWDKVVLNYDVSDRIDKWAVTFIGYNKDWQALEFFNEIELKWDINHQYDELVQIYRVEALKYVRSGKKDDVILVYDHRWMGTGLRPLFDRDQIPVICFESTNSNGWSKDDRKYTVGKNYALSLLKFNIASWQLLISNKCALFIDEFKHFKETVTNSGYSKFQAEQWHTDDFVTSLLMGNWFAMDIMWAKYTLTKKVHKEEPVAKDVELFWRLHDAPPIKEHDDDLYDLFGY